MKLPAHIWHLTDNTPGLNVCILGGVHGDERPGIETVRQLLWLFGLQYQGPRIYEAKGVKGNLFIGFGNPNAIVYGTRGSSLLADLNRSFVETNLDRTPETNDSPELVRARELALLFRECDVLIDLHATHTASPPLIYTDHYTTAHAALGDCIPTEYVLTDGDGEFNPTNGPATTTDAFVDRHGRNQWRRDGIGGVGLCLEIGQKDENHLVPNALKAVVRLLRHIGVIDDTFMPGKLPIAEIIPNHDKKVYVLRERVDATGGGFRYEPSMEIGFAAIRQGGVIGRYGNGNEVLAPRSGVVVLQWPEWAVFPGGGLCWIAERS